jgi:hypothetical protein
LTEVEYPWQSRDNTQNEAGSRFRLCLDEKLGRKSISRLLLLPLLSFAFVGTDKLRQDSFCDTGRCILKSRLAGDVLEMSDV